MLDQDKIAEFIEVELFIGVAMHIILEHDVFALRHLLVNAASNTGWLPFNTPHSLLPEFAETVSISVVCSYNSIQLVSFQETWKTTETPWIRSPQYRSHLYRIAQTAPGGGSAAPLSSFCHTQWIHLAENNNNTAYPATMSFSWQPIFWEWRTKQPAGDCRPQTLVAMLSIRG